MKNTENNMSNMARTGVLLAVAGCLLAGQPSVAAEAIKGNLVDVRWLERNLRSPNVLILDASPAPVYAAQHIPGAVGASMLVYGAEDKPAIEMERLFQSWGISPGKTIVLYDSGGTYLATRVLFSLYYHGYPAKDLVILDGGLSKWQEAGLPVTKEVTPAPKPGSFKVGAYKDEVRGRLPEVLTASGDPARNVLVEALGPDWHFGEVQVFDRAGHIPNGILLPSADLFKPDKTFKSPEELRQMLAYLGIKPEQEIYTYCGGGVAASGPFFALKFILDYPKVKLFAESELGWLSDERELPYWTYDAPSLMRDTQWLQWWSGERLRTFLGARVSIVDVRPADAYRNGHVPFALNVPVDVFRDNFGRPERLAEVLGAAGVDPSLEAVVVAGAGLTKEAALAFVELERLGQKRVSVFMDSMEKWAQLGFPVAKDPTVVGPKKAPGDLAVPLTAYPGNNVRRNVVMADPKSSQGIYPKVFIASGSNVPARAPNGTVVQVPYTDLLNPDGSPKPAKDIWKILTKAGVPRYAELVCFSDDPGEAAVNYVILKLMGFPDIKVLAN
jgi:thiosulfate/3-mercaptopyruvate sulfurtransferase